MVITKDIKKLAYALLVLYALCLFWVVILKCNMYPAVEGTRLILGKMTLLERAHFSFAKFAKSDVPDIIVNILIFIPLGLLLPIFKEKSPCIFGALVSIFTTITIEIIQFLTAIGSFTYIDIINNSIGAFIGMMLYFKIRKVANERIIKIAMIFFIAICSVITIFATNNTIKNIDMYFL